MMTDSDPDVTTTADDDIEDLFVDEPPEKKPSADDGPRGWRSGPRWAPWAIGAVAAVLLLLLFRGCQGGGSEPVDESDPPTSMTIDPLAEYPKVNEVVKQVTGNTIEARQKIAGIVAQAERDKADLCSLYWGADGDGWSIQYQHPGSPKLPNATHNVPLFVDRRCYPTPTSPLQTYESVPTTTTTRPGPGVTQPARPPLNPTPGQ